MTAASPAGSLGGHLDDDDYPAYTMGRAAELLGATQGILARSASTAWSPRSAPPGGHRRYSRYQLRIAARAGRELVDQGTPIEAACRIVILEDQLEGGPAHQRRIPPRRRSGESRVNGRGLTWGAPAASRRACPHPVQGATCTRFLW